MRSAQKLIMWSGLVLIVFGLVGIGYQLFVEMAIMTDGVINPDETYLETRAFGFELVVIGAILEVAGFLGSRPWVRETHSS